jgi:hypothetical protein
LGKQAGEQRGIAEAQNFSQENYLRKFNSDRMAEMSRSVNAW